MKSQKPKAVKKQTPKKLKTVAAKKVQKAKPVTPKLSKSDPEYYAKIGAISAAKRKLNKEYFSAMAAKSHAEGSRPDGYKGGRKKKEDASE
jgi:hypothetical protein